MEKGLLLHQKGKFTKAKYQTTCVTEWEFRSTKTLTFMWEISKKIKDLAKEK
jgi:hypothetical protein